MATVFSPLKNTVHKWDLEDWLKWRHIKWHSMYNKDTKSYYIRTHYKAKIKHGLPSAYLHRVILEVSGDMVIDHKNHDTSDNRKHNLTVCTESQNGGNRRPTIGNSSPYKGVSRHKNRKKFLSRIKKDGVTHYLGWHLSEIDAAKAYDLKAIELFGEFAYLNFRK